MLAGFVLSRQVPIKSNYITSDIFDKVYVVSKSDLHQLSEEGDVFNTYSNRNFGEITFVDATNPMRILIFYVNFNQIVFVNNKLSPISESVSLDDLGFSSVGIACSSSQNGFWIFDTRNSQPVLISSALQVVYKGSIIQLSDTLSSIPIYMGEYGKKLILAFQNMGVYIFDQTGMLEKFIPITSLQYFQVSGSAMYYLSEGKLRSMSLDNRVGTSIEVDNQPFYGFTFLKDKIVLADRMQLWFYKKQKD